MIPFVTYDIYVYNLKKGNYSFVKFCILCYKYNLSIYIMFIFLFQSIPYRKKENASKLGKLQFKFLFSLSVNHDKTLPLTCMPS